MRITRVRRQGVHDEWPTCNVCNDYQAMSVGFELHVEPSDGCFLTLYVCDECLTKAKKSFPYGYPNDQTKNKTSEASPK